jgi:hypothetical protein
MADKELRIKYILDKSQFDAGIKAANRTLQDTGKHLDDGTQSALSMTKAMLGMAGVSTGLGAVQQVVGAINQSMQEAADYTKRRWPRRSGRPARRCARSPPSPARA